MAKLIQTSLFALLVIATAETFKPTPVFAQTYQARFTRQTCQQGFACRTQLEYGSAVCIGQTKADRWVFLTVAHGVSGAAATHIGLKVDGKPTWVFAKVLGWKLDQQADVALLSVPYDGKLPCYTVYSAVPAIGEEAELVGFPSTGYRRFRTKIRSRATVTGLNKVGESGGPVLVSGKLAGIQWGHSRSQNATYFTPIDVAQPLIIEKLGSWPSCQQKIKSPCQVVSNDSTPGIKSLESQIQNLKSEIGKIKRQNESRNDELPKQLARINQRLEALEPLLRRRIVLEDDAGKVTAQQIYEPSDTIRLRSRYRDRR